MRGAALVLMALSLNAPCVAQQQPAGFADLVCTTSLMLPTHGILAATATASGVVTTEGKIAVDGEIADLEIHGGDLALQSEVRIAMQLSKFAARCKGRKVRFIFSFTLQDPPTDSILPPEVHFLPPNRFELTFRRRKPNLDPAGPPPKRD